MRKLIVLSMVLIAILVGCSSGDEAATAPTAASTTTAPTAAPAAAPAAAPTAAPTAAPAAAPAAAPTAAPAAAPAAAPTAAPAAAPAAAPTAAPAATPTPAPTAAPVATPTPAPTATPQPEGKVEFEYEWTVDKSGNRNLAVVIVNNTNLTQKLMSGAIEIFDADGLRNETILFHPDYEGNMQCQPKKACIDVEDFNYEPDGLRPGAKLEFAASLKYPELAETAVLDEFIVFE